MAACLSDPPVCVLNSDMALSWVLAHLLGASAPRGKFLLMLFTWLEAQGRGHSWAEGLGNSQLPGPGCEGP